jgi:hypothetical protein
MATLTRTTLTPVGSTYQGTGGGQAAGWQAVAAGGDLIPISSGKGTILRFKSAGTAAVVTLNSAVLTAYGSDVDVQISLSATDEQEVFIVNDGVSRFDQQPTNPQLLSATYSTSTNVQVAAKTIP